MADPTFGITRHPQYFLSPEWSEEIAAGGPAYKRLRDLYPGQTLYGPGEHPFRTSYAFVEDNLFLDPDVYLARLVSEFRSVGGRIEIGRVAGPEGLSHLEERVVFNCTGLGARDVARDESVEPLMGQHLVLEPQDGVRYAVASARGDYMMATGSRVVLGGGNSISSPDELVERQRALLPRAPGRSG